MSAEPTGSPDPYLHWTAVLLARYGELATELEDTTDPARRADLEALLDKFDRSITRLAAQATDHAPGGPRH